MSPNWTVLASRHMMAGEGQRVMGTSRLGRTEHTSPTDRSSAWRDAKARSMSMMGMKLLVTGAGVTSLRIVTDETFQVNSGTVRISSTNRLNSLPRSARYAVALPLTPMRMSTSSATARSARVRSLPDTHRSLLASARAASGMGRPPQMPYRSSVRVRRTRSRRSSPGCLW